MIVYQGTKRSFLDDSMNRDIEDLLADAFLAATGRYAPQAEYRAWQASLGQMAKVLHDEDIHPDVGIGIEYGIPQSSKRIDFLISGVGADEKPGLVIVELKQWSSAKLTSKDGIVVAQRGGRSEREGAHPSYQAWSYAALLEGFNEAVYDNHVDLRPCAYLHNYRRDGVIDHPHYAPYIDKAPVFLRGDEERERLRAFIKRHLSKGDKAELLVRIENGRIRPSKMLAESLAKMLRGSREFVLVDDQKVAYEAALAAARGASDCAKRVLIVQGGPGTGKSVIAVNLLVELTHQGLMAKYVSKNAAPRKVYAELLKGKVRTSVVSNMFSGSGAFTETPKNEFDVLVVDEAHRLNEKSGLYANLGDNQIKELVNSAACTIFFVDDDQIVTLTDIGHSKHLEQLARNLGASVEQLSLESQFRCNGSDGYLAWLDDALGVHRTANPDFDPAGFDFRVVESPTELHALIAERNGTRNKSRVVAGYCWDWKSKRNPEAMDIEIPEHGYARQWNLASDQSLWIIAPESVEQVGCIHTCQGLEVEYVGVIVGPDLVAVDGRLVTRPDARSAQDRTIRGWRTAMQSDPDGTSERVDRIIRNTYRTLMTRGMKGCYIYCVDADTQEYFRQALQRCETRK